MGLIDRLFGKPKAAGEAVGSRFETLTAYSPTFTSWGGQIYESELVRAAVDARARHVGKLKYTMEGPAQQKLWTATKSEPNPWYTWPQFLERCSNIYDVQNNLFIVPILDRTGEVMGYFPVVPSSCEVVDHGGVPYLRYTFVNGQKRSMELSRCAVITSGSPSPPRSTITPPLCVVCGSKPSRRTSFSVQVWISRNCPVVLSMPSSA